MKTKSIIWLLVIVLIIIGIFVSIKKDNISSPTTNSDIKVFTPIADSVIHSPLAVSGEAKGTWFFEASFPIQILDANGNVLGQTPAQAKGEWMTTNFVPFNASIEFKTSTTPTGMLVLKKDNPSGLPQNDASITIPIKFR